METVVSVLLMRYLVIAAVVLVVILLAVGVLAVLLRRGAVDRGRAADLARRGARWVDERPSSATDARARVAGTALKGVARRLDRTP